MANGTEVFSPCMSAAAGQFWVMELKEILGRKRKGGKIGGGMKETEWEGTDGVDEWIFKIILKAAARGI